MFFVSIVLLAYLCFNLALIEHDPVCQIASKRHNLKKRKHTILYSIIHKDFLDNVIKEERRTHDPHYKSIFLRI